MKKYEGLFILNTAGKEEGVKELIDKISDEITHAGGKVETVQKMDKKPVFARGRQEITRGFYVNVIFESEPGNVAHLKQPLRA